MSRRLRRAERMEPVPRGYAKTLAPISWASVRRRYPLEFVDRLKVVREAVIRAREFVELGDKSLRLIPGLGPGGGGVSTGATSPLRSTMKLSRR
jgi:hypothetical protein